MRYQVSGKQIDIGTALQQHVKSEIDEVVSKYAERPTVSDIRSLVHDLKDRGIGVLITDHNVRETLDIVSHAYILHDGKVLMAGAPDEVVANENVRRVYLGDNFKIS